MRSSPSSLPVDFAQAIERSRDRLGRLGSTILYFPSIDSTSDLALTLIARALPSGEWPSGAPPTGGSPSPQAGRPPPLEGTVIVADHQTAGRGRRGRIWFSPPGSGLYVSVVLAPARARTDPARAVGLVTLAAGVALSEAVETAAGLKVEIKWPNDLVLARRKLAGILAEATHSQPPGRVPLPDAVVLGYGINVGPAAFPPDLRDRATSLETELGRPIDRAGLFVDTLARLQARYTDLLEGRFDGILDAWRRLAPTSVGARIAWPGPSGVEHAVTAGIDKHGALLARCADRIERIVAGDITWL